MMRSWTAPVSVVGVLVAVLLGCSATATATAATTTGMPPTAPSGGPATLPPAAASAVSSEATPPEPGGRIATAWLTIPSIGIKHLRIVPYAGTTDDWPGTRIQNRALAAAPYGTHGGVGPGQIGNYLVTAHRLSAGGPFREVPALRTGDKIYVTTRDTTYTYTVTATRKTDFRSARSLTEQRAAVPGSPGRKPTRAMITVSTCATLEDNAAGNRWRDAKDNPQHRIDKVGVLTSRAKAPAGSG